LFTNDVHIIGGDFNMSLYSTVGELRKRGSAVTLLAAHAWRQVGVISAVAEGEDDDNDDQPHHQMHGRAANPLAPGMILSTVPPPPPLWLSPPVARVIGTKMPSPPPLPRNLAAVAAEVQQAPRPLAPAAAGQVQHAAGPEEMASIRCDSCGIFAVGNTQSVKRVLTVEHFTGAKTMELMGSLQGAGYGVKSYMLGLAGVEASLANDAAVAPVAVAAGTVRRPPLPPFAQKPMSRFDPTGMLSRGGAAHMPLAVFVGGAASHRSAPAVDRRKSMRPDSGQWGRGNWAGRVGPDGRRGQK
jgi:hypothetical protein